MKDFFKESDCDVTRTIDYRHATSLDSGIITCLAISIEKANRLIRERGKVVYGCERKPGEMNREWLRPVTENNVPIGSSHTAILLNIEPVEQDSAEKFVADFYEKGVCDEMNYQDLFQRAKALLDRKGEK